MFWENVRVQENGCWLWVGKLTDSGYGRFFRRGKEVRAHRRAYELVTGKKLPKDIDLHHFKCHTEACVNFEHVQEVPHNNHPESGNEGKVTQTHCIHGHEFSKENTYIAIRANASSVRMCRTCISNRSREFYRRVNGVSKACFRV